MKNTGQSAKQRNSGEVEKGKDGSSSESSDDSEDEFNPTLAAMESEIKPKVLKNSKYINKRIY